MGCQSSKADVSIPSEPPCGSIVMHFTYLYKNSADKDKVNSILDKSVAYNTGNGMKDTCLKSMSFTQHPDGKGYDAIEVFKDAESAEKYYRAFEACPDMQEFMSLAEMIECKRADIIATKEERDKAPTIALYYSLDVQPNKYIERSPTNADTGKPHFGWTK